MAGILPNPEQACTVPAFINLHDLYACSMLDKQCKTRTGLTSCKLMWLGAAVFANDSLWFPAR